MTSPEDLTKMYELAIQDAHYFSRLHHDKVTFYSGLFSGMFALAAASFALDIPARHFGPFLIGLAALSVVMVAIGIVALDATGRAHTRYFEAVTVRGKIEQALGMTDVREATGREAYWPTEPFVPATFIERRSKFGSSKEFIDDRTRNSISGKAVRGLFLTLIVLSAAAALVLLICGVSSILGSAA